MLTYYEKKYIISNESNFVFEVYMEFKEKIRILRRKAGFTQKELATLIGVTYRTYQNYESGASTPSYDKLAKLASVLKIGLDMLKSDGTAEQATIENGELRTLVEATEKLFMNSQISDSDKKSVISVLTNCFWKSGAIQNYTRKKNIDV